MAKITIGREYREEFDSIVWLANGKYLAADGDSPSLITYADENVIRTNTNEFVLDLNSSGINGNNVGGETDTVGMEKDGASWFAVFRGKEVNSAGADWENLIEEVARLYHKRYSYIEFKQITQDGAKNSVAVIMDNLCKFLTRLKKIEFKGAGNVKTLQENIYGVTLKMNLNIAGTGESAPVLGKIYFREKNKRLRPLIREEAAQVDAGLANQAPEGGNVNNTDNSRIAEPSDVARVMDAVKDVLGKSPAANLYFSEEKDREEINSMLELMANLPEKVLNCTAAKVLSVSNVEWVKSIYDISCNGKVVFSAEIGLNGSVSLKCANCESPYDIIRDNVLYKDGKPTNTVADPLKDNLGFGDADIERLERNTDFGKHMMLLDCTGSMSRVKCSKIVCGIQTVDGKDGRKYCKDCVHPEILYKDIFDNDKSVLTQNADYAADIVKLVERKKKDKGLATCSCCGRQVLTLKEGEMCEFCYSLFDEGYVPSSDDKRLYKKHKKMLGLTVRLKHLFSVKYSRQDKELFIFVMGKEKFYFNKLDVNEFGFIKKPLKMNKGGDNK